MVELDRIDTRILAALQSDASLAIAELAEAVGLSSNACWRRVKRLEELARAGMRYQGVKSTKIFCYPTCRTGRHWMDVQAMRDRNVLLRIEDYAGRPVDGFNGIPLRVSDQLLITESRVI